MRCSKALQAAQDFTRQGQVPQAQAKPPAQPMGWQQKGKRPLGSHTHQKLPHTSQAVAGRQRNAHVCAIDGAGREAAKTLTQAEQSSNAASQVHQPAAAHALQQLAAVP